MSARNAARPSSPVLEARGLAYHRGGRALLADIDLGIAPGTFTALVGPNGAGKSTLLRLLAGLATPDAGMVALDGSPIAALDERRRARRIGWLSQFPPTELPLSVHDYVLLGRRPTLGSFGHAGAADLDRVAAALAAFELDDRARHPWRALSGGERQRAALARLLAQDVPIWLLDEPTNHLDLKHQALLLRRLRDEVDAGRTVIAVLHELGQAARVADQVLLLRGGRRVAAGTPGEALTDATLSAAYDWPVHVSRDGAAWRIHAGA